MAQNGLDIKPSTGFHPTPVPNYDYNAPASTSRAWSVSDLPFNSQQGGALRAPLHDANLFHALPSSRTGCTGDNYLGVSFGNPNLSVKGTALSILGMEIDIADFDSPDMDEPDPSVFHPQLYNKSYQSFLQSVLNVNTRIEKVDLPTRSVGMTYAKWYFGVINPYFPILHGPTFFKTVSYMALRLSSCPYANYDSWAVYMMIQPSAQARPRPPLSTQCLPSCISNILFGTGRTPPNARA